MAQAQRIRGQESTLRILIVDALGEVIPLEGSFLKVVNFDWNVDGEIVSTGFIGEKTDDQDYRIDSFSGSFQIHKTDTAAIDYVKRLVAAHMDGLAPPRATLVETTKYRGISEPQTLTFVDAIIGFGGASNSGRKDYQTSSFDFKSKDMI